MSHRGEIENLLNRYALAYDENDMGEMAACFTEDAVLTMRVQDGDLVGPFEGRDEIVRLMKDSLASQNDQRRHVTTNMVVRESDATAAKVVSYLTLIAAQDGTSRLLSTARYDDELARVDGGWRFSRRHVALDLPY